MALDQGMIDLRAPIRVRLSGSVVPGEDAVLPEDYEPGTPWIADTTLGRVLFNELLPTGYPFVNDELPKKRQAVIVNDLAEHYPMSVVAQTLDRLKEAGFHWATRSGMTVAIGDVIIPPEKEEILARHEIEAERVEKAYQRGNLSHAERNDDLVKIWEAATKEIEDVLPAAYPKDNPVSTLVAAGAAGNWIQVRSLDVIVRESDCGTERGVDLPMADRYADGSLHINEFIETSVQGRVLATDLVDASGTVIVPRGTDMREQHVKEATEASITRAKVRSVLTCEAAVGTCATCYGRSLATGNLVDVGEAVGIVAAQSIGEPGTQLTMRTFHTGAASG